VREALSLKTSYRIVSSENALPSTSVSFVVLMLIWCSMDHIDLTQQTQQCPYQPSGCLLSTMGRPPCVTPSSDTSKTTSFPVPYAQLGKKRNVQTLDAFIYRDICDLTKEPGSRASERDSWGTTRIGNNAPDPTSPCLSTATKKRRTPVIVQSGMILREGF